MNILDGLNTQQEMALYLRLGRRTLEMLAEQARGTGKVPGYTMSDLMQVAATHKLELVETPPDIVPEVNPHTLRPIIPCTTEMAEYCKDGGA